MTSAKALAIIEGTKALLLDPANWTKGENARDSRNVAVESNDSTAVCWCLLGGLIRVANTVDSNDIADRYYDEAKSIVRSKIPDKRYSIPNIVVWNDDELRTHGEVMLVLDKAIAEAKGVRWSEWTEEPEGNNS